MNSDKSRYKGTEVVEAAVMFPLLLLLTMGAIEYGWLFLKSQHVTNAARQSARLAIRPHATNGEVIDLIDQLMIEGGMAASSYSVQFTPPDVSAVAVGETFEVEITVPSANVVIIDTSFIPVPDFLRSAVSMTKEGP